MSDTKPPELLDETKQFATYIAMAVRNAMEDFHCEHLTDEQMMQLNPIVRNAICTALHAFNHYERDEQAQEFVDFQFRMIPRYWEVPELLPDYMKLWKREG